MNTVKDKIEDKDVVSISVWLTLKWMRKSYRKRSIMKTIRI